MQGISQLILQCRAGFEKEAAAEITDRLGRLGIYGYCQLESDEGYVSFIPQQPTQALEAVNKLDFDQLVFVRQWGAYTSWLELDREDRVSQLIAELDALPQCSSVLVEYPDTTEGRELATFARKFSSALVQRLKKERKLDVKSAFRLQLFVLSGDRMAIGVVQGNNASSWAQGIPRLKFPKDAPSRSTLKLEEAWHWFVPKDEWDVRLAGSQTAVDLGAAPGGWTWQLVNKSMFVTAVDNGPMNEDLMASGQVVHCQEDGYLFQPEKPVNWMVCDMVDKPMRTAAMVVTWALNGWCREAVVNFKLPMKQRFKEVECCMQHIRAALSDAGLQYELRAKHLYHDREEITCHLLLL